MKFIEQPGKCASQSSICTCAPRKVKATANILSSVFNPEYPPTQVPIRTFGPFAAAARAEFHRPRSFLKISFQLGLVDDHASVSLCRTFTQFGHKEVCFNLRLTILILRTGLKILSLSMPLIVLRTKRFITLTPLNLTYVLKYYSPIY